MRISVLHTYEEHWSHSLRGRHSEPRMIAAADTANIVSSEKHKAPQQPGASAIPSFTLRAYPMTAEET